MAPFAPSPGLPRKAQLPLRRSQKLKINNSQTKYYHIFQLNWYFRISPCFNEISNFVKFHEISWNSHHDLWCSYRFSYDIPWIFHICGLHKQPPLWSRIPAIHLTCKRRALPSLPWSSRVWACSLSQVIQLWCDSFINAPESSVFPGGQRSLPQKNMGNEKPVKGSSLSRCPVRGQLTFEWFVRYLKLETPMENHNWNSWVNPMGNHHVSYCFLGKSLN